MMGMNPEPNSEDTYQWANEIRTQIKWHEAASDIDYWIPVTQPPEPMNSDYARIRQWQEDGKIAIADPDPPPVMPQPPEAA
jgi:hypothetical protein